jgi:wyosine [tRNA(Phe)-imidazoG37] synthetase (radical SAM superfamily)
MEKDKYKYLYGPVPSRRLGLSLGVDIIPSKYCTYSCVYCQLKRTDHLTVERRAFYPVDDILDEIRRRLSEIETKPDRITFSGSGEPTLNSDIGKIINGIKKITDIPVAVITNGSLLWMQEVRNDIKNADLVVPSMDAVRQESFKKVNRPHPSLDPEKVMEGIIQFREEYSGQLWLEVLLVDGINDADDDISSLIKFVERLKPNRVQLNTVVRPPAEEFAGPLTPEALEAISQRFSPKAEVIAEFAVKSRHNHDEPIQKNLIIDMLNRRPCTIDDMMNSLSFDKKDIRDVVLSMEKEGVIESKKEKNGVYYYLKR